MGKPTLWISKFQLISLVSVALFQGCYGAVGGTISNNNGIVEESLLGDYKVYAIQSASDRTVK